MLFRRAYRHLFIYSFLFFISTALQAQEGEVVLENSLLWEVKGNGLSTPSYLFGTVHLFCKDSLQLPEIVFSKLRQSETVFFEINMDQYEDSANHQFMKGTTLQQLVGKPYFKAIKKRLANQFPYSDDSLNRLHPWVVSMMISASLLECETTSVEKLLQQEAHQYKKPVRGLESYTTHFTMSSNGALSLKEQARNLKTTVYNTVLLDRPVRRLNSLDLYRKSNITAMYVTSAYRQGMRTKESKYILDTRNLHWIPVMVAAMDQSATFFAFGAAHLAGASGIIHLLRQKGYTVTPAAY